MSVLALYRNVSVIIRVFRRIELCQDVSGRIEIVSVVFVNTVVSTRRNTLYWDVLGCIRFVFTLYLRVFGTYLECVKYTQNTHSIRTQYTPIHTNTHQYTSNTLRYAVCSQVLRYIHNTYTIHTKYASNTYLIQIKYSRILSVFEYVLNTCWPWMHKSTFSNLIYMFIWFWGCFIWI